MDKYSLLLTLFTLPTFLPPLRSLWFLTHTGIVAGSLWLLNEHFTLTNQLFIISFFTLHLLSINAITFLLYYIDKRAAIRNTWRIPEKRLHIFALIGGTPAAYYASKILRHKTIKRSFRMNFTAIVIIQILAFICSIFIAMNIWR